MSLAIKNIEGKAKYQEINISYLKKIFRSIIIYNQYRIYDLGYIFQSNNLIYVRWFAQYDL